MTAYPKIIQEKNPEIEPKKIDLFQIFPIGKRPTKPAIESPIDRNSNDNAAISASKINTDIVNPIHQVARLSILPYVRS